LIQPASERVDDCELAAAVEARSTLLKIGNRRKLFRQGQAAERIFLLRKGEVVLTLKLSDGSVLGFKVLPGTFVGLVAVAGNQPYSMTATVAAESELHAISKTAFQDVVGQNARLSSRVQQLLDEAKSVRLAPLRLLRSSRPVTG